MTVWGLILIGAIALGCGGALHPTAPPPVRAPAEVGLLVVDDAAFAEFAVRVRATTSDAFILAVLDALADDWTGAVARLDQLRAHEPDPDRALLTGMSIRIWYDARAHGGDNPEAFRGALERLLAALPERPAVAAALSELRAMGQAFTPATCRQLVNENVEPGLDGTLTPDQIHIVVFQRYAAVRLAPVGKVIEEVLAARGVALPTPSSLGSRVLESYGATLASPGSSDTPHPALQHRRGSRGRPDARNFVAPRAQSRACAAIRARPSGGADLAWRRCAALPC